MLLEFGNTVAELNWQLDENLPTGYSRVYYVQEADIMYRDAKTECALMPNTLYALPSSAPYRAWRLSDKDFRVTYMHIDFFPKAVSSLVTMPVQPGSALESFLMCIYRAIDEGKTNLVHSLARSFETVFEHEKNFIHPSGQMTNILVYIASHLNEDISIATLSDLTGYHPHYFIKLFKQAMGMSPHQYILRTRLQEAARILRSGGTVSEAAYKVGYADTSSFARAFKSYYGVQPGRFTQESPHVP
jgi:AraC-like DNA-binding protein